MDHTLIVSLRSFAARNERVGDFFTAGITELQTRFQNGTNIFAIWKRGTPQIGALNSDFHVQASAKPLEKLQDGWALSFRGWTP
jgi:hypothetical protein